MEFSELKWTFPIHVTANEFYSCDTFFSNLPIRDPPMTWWIFIGSAKYYKTIAPLNKSYYDDFFS